MNDNLDVSALEIIGARDMLVRAMIDGLRAGMSSWKVLETIVGPDTLSRSQKAVLGIYLDRTSSDELASALEDMLEREKDDRTEKEPGAV